MVADRLPATRRTGRWSRAPPQWAQSAWTASAAAAARHPLPPHSFLKHLVIFHFSLEDLRSERLLFFWGSRSGSFFSRSQMLFSRLLVPNTAHNSLEGQLFFPLAHSFPRLSLSFLTFLFFLLRFLLSCIFPPPESLSCGEKKLASEEGELRNNLLGRGLPPALSRVLPRNLPLSPFRWLSTLIFPGICLPQFPIITGIHVRPAARNGTPFPRLTWHQR